ncbi:MAG: GH3 auxin-responsive promoter family protein [Phycisphaerae bacterium]
MVSRRSWLDPVLSIISRAHAHQQSRRFLSEARCAARAQERALRAILARNADSDYGREHGFSRIRGYRDFTMAVPVQTYEDLRPCVERVMAGDTSALFGPGQRVLMFAMTSGSTDKPKYVPVTPMFLAGYRRGWNVFGLKALLDHPDALSGTILQVASPMDEHRTDHGIPCGSISGLLAASQKRLVRKYYANPTQTSRISNPEARYYTVMRLAVQQNVTWMITASPATQIKLATAVAGNADRLIRDVHDGTLTAPGHVPDTLQRGLVEHLQPDCETAKRLELLASQHGELLPKHYWRLALLANWTGGTIGLHLGRFPHYFGKTPVRDIGLLATEGRVSIPLEDGTAAGVLDVGASFFEFVDASDAGSDPSSIHLCHELTPGNEYRVIMTTTAGFYRYDIGDHVRVRGYLGEAPIVEFLHRGARVSSITGEKLTEWQVVEAFRRASQRLGCALTLFALAPQWSEQPFYRLHVNGKLATSRRLAEQLDLELAKINLEYRSKRSSGRLGPIQVNCLSRGTLARVDAIRRSRRGGANEQYKPRYLYSHPGEDAFLSSSGEIGESSPSVSHRPVTGPRVD